MSSVIFEVANYDEPWLGPRPIHFRGETTAEDWNEFFCDPARMVEGLLLQDGTRLFDLPHERRFLALPRVDWQVRIGLLRPRLGMPRPCWELNRKRNWPWRP